MVYMYSYIQSHVCFVLFVAALSEEQCKYIYVLSFIFCPDIDGEYKMPYLYKIRNRAHYFGTACSLVRFTDVDFLLNCGQGQPLFQR